MAENQHLEGGAASGTPSPAEDRAVSGAPNPAEDSTSSGAASPSGGVVASEASTNSAERQARRDRALETATAVLLGVTSLLVAWATWVGSLHGGHEQIHFTESTNTAAAATALYNDATQMVVQDVAIWGSAQNFLLDVQAAEAAGDDQERKAAEAKIEALEEMCTPEFREAVEWSRKTGKSPFEMEGYAQSYYEEARALAEESQEILAEGKQDNLNSHRFGLVTVIYSLVLFLLGISNTFKRSPNRMTVLGTAVVLLVIGFVFMLSIPLPEGFNILDYLGAS